MATISGLTEDFEGGANGAAVTTANSVFTSVTGTVAPTFSSADSVNGTRSMLVTTVAQSAQAVCTLVTPRANAWPSVYVKVHQYPTTTTAIMNWWNGASKVGDLQMQSDGTLRLRDNSTTKWTAVTPLTIDQWFRLSLHTQPGSASGHRVIVYPGLYGTTPFLDSGDQSATAGAQAQVSEFRFGLLSSSTGSIRFDRLRGDDAAEVAGLTAPAQTVPAGAGETLTHALNRVAGTVGLEAQGAAQVWANAPGMDLLGCLNKKNGTSGVGLLGVLNSLAGTTALDVEGAAAHLV